jgi:transcriptional regulator with XRE-family HTH domain
LGILMPKTHVEKFIESSPENLRAFYQEQAIFDVTELLERTMRLEGVNRAELATKLKRSKGWVTQLLDGEGNKTIRTIADVLAVLGYQFVPSAEKLPLVEARTEILVAHKSERWDYEFKWEVPASQQTAIA